MPRRLRLRLWGLVQGVGFRPFLHALAHRFRLTGFVFNHGEGLTAELQGAHAHLLGFQTALRNQLPPLARVDGMDIEELPCQAETAFRILQSPEEQTAPLLSVGPDMAPCPACLEELFSPDNRRFQYPFLNCTHCGPRYAVSLRMPWDRPNTTLAGFPMCPACAGEYENPADRRFHAQPTACPACGPALELPPQRLVQCILQGGILALKAVGGFQLACDALNQDAVLRLRLRKMRDAKPFAVMVPSLAAARHYAALTDAEEALLAAPERPILLVRARHNHGLAPAVAPGLAHLGLCLPSCPLHEVLFACAARMPVGPNTAPTAWVMSSANFSGEPLIKDNAEALEKLSGLADVFALHNRPVAVRMDDSVMQVAAGAPQLLRRARGFVPRPLPFAWKGPPLLAVGAHLKSTFCLVHNQRAYVSQHLGDLDAPASRASFLENVQHLCTQLHLKPALLAADLHPEYLSTQWALQQGLPCLRVQHHLAHVAAVWAEYPEVKAPLLGLALDGTGLGSDGLPWGGELLLLEPGTPGSPLPWQRLGCLKPLPLYGADAAALAPWRMAVAACVALGEHAKARELGAPHGLTPQLLQAWHSGRLHAPLSSSLGRFFDAAAALLGLCHTARFEAEAPMRLEAAAHRALEAHLAPPWPLEGYVFEEGNVLNALGLLKRLLEVAVTAVTEVTEVTAGTETPPPPPTQAAALWLHHTLAQALAEWATAAARHRGIVHVVLSGGCLQNRLLCEALVERLVHSGLVPLLPKKLPPNDGGICLGQALVAARHFG